jgi:hypothetical protein
VDIGKRNCKACIMNADGSIAGVSEYDNNLTEADGIGVKLANHLKTKAISSSLNSSAVNLKETISTFFFNLNISPTYTCMFTDCLQDRLNVYRFVYSTADCIRNRPDPHIIRGQSARISSNTSADCII